MRSDTWQVLARFIIVKEASTRSINLEVSDINRYTEHFLNFTTGGEQYTQYEY
jgi:hypothetical protein